MAYGAGVVAARKFGAREIIDPRPYAVGSLKTTFERYPATGAILPAMGYDADQRRDLEQTINRSPAEMVIIATPIDLRRLIHIEKPSQRVHYELQEIGQPTLRDLLKEKFGDKKTNGRRA
jgi:predicted GTPase